MNLIGPRARHRTETYVTTRYVAIELNGISFYKIPKIPFLVDSSVLRTSSKSGRFTSELTSLIEKSVDIAFLMAN